MLLSNILLSMASLSPFMKCGKLALEFEKKKMERKKKKSKLMNSRFEFPFWNIFWWGKKEEKIIRKKEKFSPRIHNGSTNPDLFMIVFDWKMFCFENQPSMWVLG